MILTLLVLFLMTNKDMARVIVEGWTGEKKENNWLYDGKSRVGWI